jgi:acyl carrier protein
MRLNEFLGRLAEALLVDPVQVKPDTNLAQIEGWDSMGQLSTVALLDELGVKLPPGALMKCKNVSDITALAGERIQP